VKYFILILSFILSLILTTSTFSKDELILNLQSGGNIIFIRHALAPGTGDPENIDLNDCETQRNLNDKGIEQSKLIGDFFKKNNIPIDQVLSSEWCRCKDTAMYAFDKFNTFKPLNSFYDDKFFKNKNKQINNLKKFIDKWNGKKNLIFVTHYVVILEMLGIGTNSSELVITDKKLKIINNLRF
tara:strand:+ start:801 stop:1352 length:552 start_codon:yes stop_codon:yes gene_type:complete